MMEKIKIVNLVFTTDLKQRLYLETIATKLSYVEYNPEQFPGLVLRIKNQNLQHYYLLLEK